MQPPETLNNFSKSMKHFTANVTYLEKDDPELFDKIAKYLKWVKEPKPHLEVGGELAGMERDFSETVSFLEIPVDAYDNNEEEYEEDKSYFHQRTNSNNDSYGEIVYDRTGKVHFL